MITYFVIGLVFAVVENIIYSKVNKALFKGKIRRHLFFFTICVFMWPIVMIATICDFVIGCGPFQKQ
jgi:predicted PurR-regulated permease PerM